MCGIVGIAGEGRIDATHRRSLRAMQQCLVHRGPDEAGEYLTDDVALGHRRLAIIDLETGRQPMSNEDGTVRAVVNGEIYNFLDLHEDLTARGHRFRTSSDSECLVHLYEEFGTGCVEHLDGMFGLAIWDERRRRLLLARDRMGQKPLYYRLSEGRLMFASELKALFAAPGGRIEIEPTALLDYLTFGFIPSPKTIDRNTFKLEPGQLLIWEGGRATLQRYWDLHWTGWHDTSADETAEALWSDLEQAARVRMMADVPLGAFLSGGVDSSAVVTAMAGLARDRLVTFTCGFRERDFDERDAARETARMLGTHHQTGLVAPDAAGILDTLAWHFDEPFADASAIPTYYLSQHARRFVTVALSGDGGDELLAGYRRYRFDQYEESVRRFTPASIRRGGFDRLAAIYPRHRRLPRFLRAASTLRNLSLDAATAHGLSIATLDPAAASGLLHPDVRREIADYDPLDHVRRRYDRCEAPDHLSKCQYVDLRFGLPDGILTKVDRAGMAHGLEVRAPMLDHHFVEFAWRIPPARRIRGRRGKAPLRRALARRLGPRIAGRPKSGFEVPMDAWFRGSLGERFVDSLLHPGALAADWFSPGGLREVWDAHTRRRREEGATLWKLLMFHAWGERFLRPRPEPCTPTPRRLCIR